ncbi:MAG: AbrB/MazE/SpoVT family DNA-binding domain-containing protein [Methylacidiphilaceae bacterium]|nr:AbrB/MazE/SpoVT family DNA-binding domain-containing protein [Candidatus Methylacidiphilaceae bacterium]
MASPGTTRLSNKGQIVIPNAARKQLGLKEGDQFLVLADGETICLKLIRPPSRDEWSDLQRLAALLMRDIVPSSPSEGKKPTPKADL